MRYMILLEQRPDGTYAATVPAMPQLAEVGESRAAAIAAVERAIRAKLRDVEIIDLDIPTPTGANVWLATAGMFKDDPDLDSIVAEIYAARDASKDE